jgi:SP family arabinose:H+ symporter-like MFS transporter
MKSRIIFWSITSALAGFLFGFDTVVISGAEQRIKALWGLDSFMHGIAMASALYGTVLGSLLGGWPADRFGRKKTLLAVGLLYIVSAIGCGYAPDVYALIAARFIGGIGIGISTVVAPLYISEIAPAKYRGRLAGMFQFNIVFGIIVAYLSNYLLEDIGENAWRWMLGVPVFPSILYSCMCLFIPESPRWLLTRKRDLEAGMAVLRLIEPEASRQQIESEANEILAISREKVETGRFWSRQLRYPILLAILIAFFNQLSGVNAILYYSKRIFESAGMESKAALLSSVGIGIVNLISTFVGLWLIDRIGRRTLLYIGSFGYIFSLGLVAWAFFTEHFTFVPVFIFAFMAAHAVGQGAVIWVFISEIFPNRHRAEGQALGSFTHWIFAALLATVFPAISELIAPGYIFLFFCGMMVLQLCWVKLMVPETNGVSLEELEKQLTHTGVQ